MNVFAVGNKTVIVLIVTFEMTAAATLAVVSYGDGSFPDQLLLSGGVGRIAYTYQVAGVYIVTVTLNSKDAPQQSMPVTVN